MKNEVKISTFLLYPIFIYNTNDIIFNNTNNTKIIDICIIIYYIKYNK